MMRGWSPHRLLAHVARAAARHAAPRPAAPRPALFVAVAVAAALSLGTPAGAQTESQSATQAPRVIVGAGASFPSTVYEQWVAAFTAARADEGIAYTYETTGSGMGKERLIALESEYAGSDSELSDEQKAACPDCWFLPSLAGAIVVGTNVPGVDGFSLKIPREALAAIFLGRLTRWADLAEWNPGLGLESIEHNITVVVRADSSGTTEILTRALASFSAEWSETVGISSYPEWPIDVVRGDGNNGEAREILLRDYSLG